MLKCIEFELRKLLSNKTFLLLAALILSALTVSVVLDMSHNDYGKTVIQSEYNAYLSSVKAVAEKQGTISIFEGDKSTFSSKNIEKTAADLEKLSDVIIKSDNSAGTELLTSFGFSDIISTAFIIVLSYFVFFSEKERKLYQIIKCTSNGGVKTFFAKHTVIAFFCVLFEAVSFILVAIASVRHGCFGDLSRSVQSVCSFMECDIRCSVITMLIIYCAMRAAGLIAVSAVFSAVSLLVDNSVVYFFSSLLISSVGFALMLVNPQSAFSFFRYVNIANLINPVNYLSQYRNLNILGTPVSYRLIMVLFSVTLFVCLTLVSMSTYEKSELTAKRIKIKNPFTVGSLSKRMKSILTFELYKTSVVNKGLLVLVAFLIFESAMVLNTSCFKSPEEYYYKSYMEILSGDVTQEKIDYLESEKQRLLKCDKAEALLNEKYADGKITLRQLQNELKRNTVSQNRKNAFDRVLAQYEKISKSKNPCFIYETGYRKLLNIGRENRLFAVVDLAVMLVLVVLCASFLLPMERKSKMNIIIATAPNGTRRVTKNKIAASVIFSSSFFIIKCITEIVIIAKNYGLNGLLYSSCALFENPTGVTVPVLLLVILKFLLVCLLCVAAAVITIFISKGKEK